jgi:hypothetical protein
MEIINGEATFDFLDSIFELAAAVYSPDVVLPASILKEWHKVNPFIYWAAVATDSESGEKSVAGYLSVLPLRAEVFSLTHADPQFDEMKQIVPSDILKRGDPAANLHYVCSMVVSPKFRGSKTQPVFKLLISAYLSSIANSDSVEVTEWSGMALSAAGKHVLSTLGMQITITASDMTLYHGLTNKEHQLKLLDEYRAKISQGQLTVEHTQ